MLKQKIIFTCAFLLLITSAANVAAEVSSTAAQASIQITLSDQKDSAIRLEARQAPLAQVLKAIADKTGASIHYSVLPEAPVTATCVGAVVGQIMDCLVAKQVGLVANSPKQGKSPEFWLLGSSVGSCQAVTVAPAAPIQAVVVQEYKPTPEEQAQYDQGMQLQTNLLIEQYKNAKNSQERADALVNLVSGGSGNDPNARKVLDAAAADKDPSLRSQAISIMASLDKEGAADLIGRALHDSETTVRMTAVGAAGDDAELLKQALTDSNAQVRELAEAKLAQIKKREGR